MTPYYADDHVTIYHGDCIDVMRDLPDASVDAVVTDPPYGLGFMGKDWDDAAALASRPASADDVDERFRNVFPRTGKGPSAVAFDGGGFQQWCEEWATQALRVLKPGGHLLAFGGTRTWHRLACAIEDAGFEVRDSIAWMYGSGFPKSLDVSKAIDKVAGVEREVVGTASTAKGAFSGPPDASGSHIWTGNLRSATPATADAAKWQGWGTALKPAFEPIVVARKPLIGTVAQNVLTHGTGALNVDGCRVGTEERINPPMGAPHNSYGGYAATATATATATAGRWPANVILDESQAAELDRQSGVSTTPPTVTRGAGGQHGAYSPIGAQDDVPCYGDTGGASRFFRVITTEDESWHQNVANIAEPSSSQPSAPGASAPSDAATWESHALDSETPSPSTSATPSASRQSGATATPTMLSTGSGSSPESPHSRRTPTSSHASDAETSEPTGTTTTTPSRSTSDGSAASATSPDTSSLPDRGGLDSLSSRFIYEPKAPTSERPRVGGLAHPTTKPLDLMRYLVRLVTPPGGVVLEPFAGSGTTAEACIIEGFRCIAIEREADYLPLILQRISKPIETVMF